MFGSRNRKRIADLQVRVEALIEQRDAAERDAADYLGAAKRTAARNAHLGDQLEAARNAAARRPSARHEGRIERLARAVAGLRKELAAETRRADRLQARLDDACGITTPAVEAGSAWQHRRSDRPLATKEDR
ncbi:hypothetical protein ACFWXI_06740 [[Kitasatospora] papulosa]|uniref:hypothetical protein n=1 Tax=[Kitasatospora] papulosa TaxID=1464011 RepID=UPI0036C7F313